jgi:CRP/FNR family cyclic AMP-dependent transcriptional regulator
METIFQQIREHPFLEGFPETLFEGLKLCAQQVRFSAEDQIYTEGDDAEEFFLIQTGQVALELHAGQHGTLIIQTIGPGEVLGWSWLFAPYRRRFDARAVTPVTALALEAECLRRQSEQNHHLGHELYRRFSMAVVTNLQAARIQLLDLYSRRPPLQRRSRDKS